MTNERRRSRHWEVSDGRAASHQGNSLCGKLHNLHITWHARLTKENLTGCAVNTVRWLICCGNKGNVCIRRRLFLGVKSQHFSSKTLALTAFFLVLNVWEKYTQAGQKSSRAAEVLRLYHLNIIPWGVFYGCFKLGDFMTAAVHVI